MNRDQLEPKRRVGVGEGVRFHSRGDCDADALWCRRPSAAGLEKSVEAVSQGAESAWMKSLGLLVLGSHWTFTQGEHTHQRDVRTHFGCLCEYTQCSIMGQVWGESAGDGLIIWGKGN